MMIFNFIIINSSFIYLFIYLFLSFILSYLLYRKHSSLSSVPRFLKLILFFLRFLTFFILFFLLLDPELKKKEHIQEPPTIVFLQDNSESIISHSDSIYYQTKYLDLLDSIQSSDLNIDIFNFDQVVRKEWPTFAGKMTNLSSAIDEVYSIYSNLNVGAYILASDGLYNEGLNPLYTNLNLNAPLHTVFLGDSTKFQDVSINLIRHNNISYLGNRAPVEIIVNVDQMINSNILLEVFDSDMSGQKKTLLHSEEFIVPEDYYIHNCKFFISPTIPGLQRYVVKVSSSLEEQNITNNTEEFFIDVINDRKKILLLFANHHPDVAAIQESLESFEQYELHTYWLNDLVRNNMSFDQNDYSLLILHQVSSHELINNNFNNTPKWYVVSANSNLSTFNQDQIFTSFRNTQNSSEYANLSLNRSFSLFVVSDSLKDFLSLTTPFLTSFSDIDISYLSDVLFYKKIGSLNTEKPVLFFAERDYKVAYLLGEGLWRWRLNDSYLNNNNKLFNQLISKMIQYLLLDEDKDRLHVDYDPVQISDKRIFFEAELYNNNYELINSYDLNMTIVDSTGQHYDYQFVPSNDNRYYLDVTLLKGIYSFIAETKVNNEVLIDKGRVVVSDFSKEKSNLVADYSLLSNLASTHSGTIINVDSLGYLISEITSSLDFKPKTYINYNFKSLINFKSLLILIIITLFLEWFLRRRYINY